MRRKGLGILHQERKGQVNTIVMEHFHKSGPANKQHTYRSIRFNISLAAWSRDNVLDCRHWDLKSGGSQPEKGHFAALRKAEGRIGM